MGNLPKTWRMILSRPGCTACYRQALRTYHEMVRELCQRYDIQVTPPLRRQLEQAICQERQDDTHILTDVTPMPHLVEALDLPLGVTRIWLVTTHRLNCEHTPRCAWHDLVIAHGRFRSAGGQPETPVAWLAPDWQAQTWTVLRQAEVMGLGFDQLVEHVRAALKAEKEEQLATD